MYNFTLRGWLSIQIMCWTEEMTSTAKQGVLVTVIILLSALTGCCEDNTAVGTVITQPIDVTVTAGEVAVFTCVVDMDENPGNNIVWKRSDKMGKAITLTNTDHYMMSNKFTDGFTRLTSTLKITDVRMEHAGLYQLVVTLRGVDVISRNTSLTVLTAKITTQPQDVTVCVGEVAVFTCVVDRNGTNITSDGVMWQQIRVGGSILTLFTSLTGGVPFSITTTISGDVLTSTLTITGVTDSNVLGTSLYRCIVNDMMSRDASLHVSSGLPGMPMNIRFSDITNTSFVVQWDEVDDADWYIVNWKDDGGSSVRESKPSLTPHTIKGLTPNTTYVVYVGVINACGSGQNSSIKSITTNMSGYLLLPSSVSTSLSVLTTPLTMFSTIATIPKATDVHDHPTSSASDSNGGGAGAVIGGVVGGLIAVIVLVIIVTVICWCAYNTKSDDDDQQKKAYATLQSQQDTLTKNYEERNPVYDYAAINKLVSVSVPHQATTDGVQYAVSTKTASKEGQDELPPLEDSYATVDKEKHITLSVPHQMSAGDVQYAVSTKVVAKSVQGEDDDVKDPEGQITLSVPHQMSAGAVQYAVSTKVAAKSLQGEDDDVKDPEWLNYADLQHDDTPGNKPRDDHQNTVKYTQVI